MPMIRRYRIEDEQGRACSVADCTSPIRARGMCNKHWTRLMKHGDPEYSIRATAGACEEWCRTVAAPYTGDECLIFPFSRATGGYGLCTVSHGRIGAHRYVCELAHGKPSEENLVAAHSCGNGHLGCATPNHLRWATTAENNKDTEIQGRIPWGEGHHAAKLVYDDVTAIKTLRAKGLTCRAIASQFGVATSTIKSIVNGYTWRNHASEGSR